MSFASPPPMFDIAQLFPELAPLAATSMRLHPRRGKPELRDSSVSGPLLWPADDPWPWCTDSPYEHDEPNAYQPLLQVFARDAPTMFFPDGCDLLQLLWCPNETCSPEGHPLAGCPRPLARWRASADVTDVLVSPPTPEVVSDEWFPCHPCVVSPEPVTEYPYIADLPQELQERIYAWEPTVDRSDDEGNYQYSLSTVPGTKTGGHPNWAPIDPRWPACSCGRRMTYLLTIDDGEGGATGTRWARQDYDHERETGHELMLKGGLLAFACTHCPDAPLDYRCT
ncbi:DUF1963 domain-containing protein [Yinghuangia seranimata]|uniref:DUF1963 domain-containing protein n=1 Tax=Yinghuangia seranimata TaxID=408067 RepID=UPI00248AE355|nr:DUF1963 domain-containing protein [Yinghuangia seranimata]MDI2128304.1 DUF1963 domain-containing protein [Yinghuangia seranimata]